MIAPRTLDLSVPRRVHLVGIGGSGMSALARLLLADGHLVSGVDRSGAGVLDELRRFGARILEGEEASFLPRGTEAVIHSAAVPFDAALLRAAHEAALPVLKYARALAAFAERRRLCAVAGTHGKTTTTGWLAHTLRASGIDASFAVGGEVEQLGGGAGLGKSDLFVAEACEYDRSFLAFRPHLAIVTNLEADHLDYYRDIVEIVATFRTFCTQVSGSLILHEALRETLGRAGGVRARVTTYGFSPSADVRLVPGMRKGGKSTFRALGREFQLGLPGRHNLLNAGAVLAAARELGLPLDAAAVGLASFRGVGRRLQLVGRPRGVPVVDDYAHHPTEVAAGLSALREEYAPRRIWCVFQPHQYSRTARFLREFAQALSGADRVVIPEIFAARDSLKEVSAADLVREVRMLGGHAVHIADFSSIVDFLGPQVQPGDVVVTMGAGDVGDVAGRLAKTL